MPSSKKYKLHSTDNVTGDKPAACAFFLSDAGCRNGENCKFLHSTSNNSSSNQNCRPAVPSQQRGGSDLLETSSVVSSESEGAGRQQQHQKRQQPPPPQQQQQQQQQNMMVQQQVQVAPSTLDLDPFADKNVHSANNKPSQPEDESAQKKKKKRKNKKKGDQGVDMFAAPKSKDSGNSNNNNVDPFDYSGPTTPNPNKKQKTSNTPISSVPPVASSSSSSQNDFRSFLSDLPVASFSVPSARGVPPQTKEYAHPPIPAAQPPSLGSFAAMEYVSLNPSIGSFKNANGTTQVPASGVAADPSVEFSKPSGFAPFKPTTFNAQAVANADAPFKREGGSTYVPQPPAPQVLATPPPQAVPAPPVEHKVRIRPESSDVGRKWLKAVLTTRDHVRYDTSYDFDRYKQADVTNGIQSTWVKAKPYGVWCHNNPQAIAIDCEMCETTDPLSGAKDFRALCRVSIVNAENPDEVLLDTLVKPNWPVSDYRTQINGITKEDLDNVEFTLRHAQAFMMKLCSQETIIVGHAVNNDLAALNMDHDVVADSSFLFKANDSTSAIVSLRDTVMTLFKEQMPDTHDSVNDARKALACVVHWMENDGNVDSIERTPRPGIGKGHGHQLFVHRIPKVCKSDHLLNMFLKHTTIQPTEVEEIQFTGSSGKTHVNFKTNRHADLAFDSIEGKAEEEKSGRLQKKVYLRNGDYVHVRKMMHVKKRWSLMDGEKDGNNNKRKSL
jgi:hypothetical protein